MHSRPTAHGLQELQHVGSVVVTPGLWSPGSVAVVHGLCGSNDLGNLPAEMEPGCPALAGGFPTAARPDKSSQLLIIVVFVLTDMLPPEL